MVSDVAEAERCAIEIEHNHRRRAREQRSATFLGGIPRSSLDLTVCSLLYDLVRLSVQEALLVIIPVHTPSIELGIWELLVQREVREGNWWSCHPRDLIYVTVDIAMSVRDSNIPKTGLCLY